MAGISQAPFELIGEANENTVQYLRQLMQNNIVTFRFRREDNTIVERRGTLHHAYTGAYFEDHPSEAEGRYIDPFVLKYWDITRQGWRSCRAERLIGYNAELEEIE